MLKLSDIRPEATRNETDQMNYALVAIADEIKRFLESERALNIAPKTFTSNKIIFTSALKCNQPKIKTKRHLVAKLRRDLKAAYLMVKTLELAKKRETRSLTNQLIYARGECVDLLERYNNNINIIGNLYKQNQSLHEKLDNLSSFINNGYNELKKIQSENSEEELTTLAQLKKLIGSSGKFYADYCNEYESCLKNKQKNRFMKNKIIILENHILAMKEQLNALEYRNLRLESENNKMRAKFEQPVSFNLQVAYTEVNKKKCIKGHENCTDRKHCRNSGDSVLETDSDLCTHLGIVKRLLSDQDALLKDLTNISKEISIL